MPLFRNRKSKSPSNPPSTPSPPSRYHPARSVEQLGHPAFVAPPPPINALNNNSNQRLDHYPDHRPSDYRPNYDGSSSTSTDLAPPPPSHQRPPQLQERPQPASVHRSQSQRQPHLQQRDRPTAAVAPEDPQPRRSKKSLFVRPASGFLERSVSVKGKTISHPVSQPTSPQQSPHNPLSLTDQDQYGRHPQSYSANSSPVSNSNIPPYEPRSASLAYQQQNHQQQSQRASRDNLDWPPQQLSQQPPPPAPPPHQSQSQLLQQPLPPQQRTFPSPLERSSTDPSFLEQPSSRPSPTDAPPESPRYTPDHQGHRPQPSQSRIQQDLQASSQVPPSQSQSQSPQQQQQPPPTPIANDRALADSSRQGSTAQNMPEPGRGTPTGTRTIEDPSEIDVRALLQKHEELQTKYSKVKRYYFDKEAQVQHLQNTVAHQRMAVSRTVLDDNEYANRFTRLDGAIKDLAFSVRKDWRGIPPWLHGLVTDDATTVGTKEMTAVGRAVISRWLVEEVFQRHFHPALDPALSIQLKSIEMNLRRQQMRQSTDEERENATVRLSNWRRTTFDGLGDTLSTPAAQEHRAELVEHSIAELASFLTSQLHDAALPGLEAGVRMIIENTINITEKIPLEARDVCVDYFPPNVPFVDGYMKVEAGLPPLPHPPPPADQDADDPAAIEDDSSPASVSTGPGDTGSAPAPKPQKKSVFGALMGRKPTGPGPSRASPGTHEEKPAPTEERETAPRIRFASFLTVEVRGKGPPMVLVKAPVWMIE
ncbi:hypothetical protein PMG11_04424 [Penicillium brasilianum]|uniref:Uncharacterized protein n=1 Tax=Penicillium brasilianum TaxID=104259 RepID=A0A0F7VG13_PENBI|nr:hypothetical protein PMG11_04424 [Penicillium brasilianum]